ncbi:MAG: hypothetical protein IRY92_03915 [Dactylosporangium sp.]|nr:hypothetical protein [Dactylosporangium sp.]
MSETGTFRQAAEDAYREALAAARAADMARARLDGEALTRVLREKWGLDVTVETSPAIVDGVLLRCISMAGEDPEISAALQCVMCGCPRWYQLHTGLADIGRILNEPGLREYGHGQDPFELAKWPRCVCDDYGAEPDTNELAADVAGVWIRPLCVTSVDGISWPVANDRYRWVWLPQHTIAHITTYDDGEVLVITNGLIYQIAAADLPRVLAALGIPEPPQDGGAA